MHPQGNQLPHLRQPFYNAEEHLKLLDLYSKVISDIEPPTGLCAPILWHPDISLKNLLVQKTGDPRLVGLIDWQHAIVVAYLIQAHFPHMLQYDLTFSIMVDLSDLMSNFLLSRRARDIQMRAGAVFSSEAL